MLSILDESKKIKSEFRTRGLNYTVLAFLGNFNEQKIIQKL
jgi:hypothetical protein